MTISTDFLYTIVTILVFNSRDGIPSISASWNFTTLGLPQNILIWRFTIWRNRAFLAIPRWEDKLVKIPFTLLEAPWPESGNPLQFGVGVAALPEVFPFPEASLQEEGICQHLQSVTGLDSDSRGRLWVLDSPTRIFHCTAKIVVIDLRRNEKITEIELHGVSPRDLKCLIVDPVVGQRGVQAYVTDPGDQTIIVYNLVHKNWRRLKLQSDGIFTDLAIDRKSSVLYLTGYPSHDLFSVNLDGVRNEGWKNDSVRDIAISLVGQKMGSSLGLICDLRGGLHYFMVTEIASVRWDTRNKFEAEGHSVLLQSEIVPCVTDYALDTQKNVWAIVNDRHPFQKPTNKTGTRNLKKNNKIKRRTIKIYKYNPFIL